MNMKKIKVKDPHLAYLKTHRKDVEHIVMVLEYHGYDVTSEQAARLWWLYSGTWVADWLKFPTGEFANDSLFEYIETFFEPVEES